MDLSAAIAELRRLNEPVPIPARLPGVEDVEAAERRLSLEFHPDLRRFLLEASDVVYGVLEPARVGSGDHTDFGALVEAAREQEGFPPELVPFCDDNGDYYAVAPDGRVVFWSHDGAVDESWPDLAAWIAQVWIGEHDGAAT